MLTPVTSWVLEKPGRMLECEVRSLRIAGVWDGMKTMMIGGLIVDVRIASSKGVGDAGEAIWACPIAMTRTRRYPIALHH